MRRLWIFLGLILMISCSDKEASKSLDNNIIYEYDGKSEPLYFNYTTTEGGSFESLIEKKFKEFYDLNTLLKSYPDFKEDIEKRIENFTTGTRAIFEINDSIKIVNIRQKGAFIKVSDSVDMTHVLFDVITDTQIKTDSVLAFITKKKVLIDNEEVISSKVKFTRVVIQDF